MLTVIRRPPGDHRLTRPWRRVELQAVKEDETHSAFGLSDLGMWYVVIEQEHVQGVLESIIDLQDSSLITTSVAVVRRREDCDDIFL